MAEISNDQQQITNIGNQVPPESHNLNYYQEYCRLFIANVILTTQMKELMTERDSLNGQISNLDNRIAELKSKEGSDDDKKRRIRRSAKNIERRYKCPVQTCQKQYGSEGSLNQHMKLKHPEVYAQTMKAEEEQNQLKNEENQDESDSQFNEASNNENNNF